jgi:FAD/FMN-containing dehydrogenase
MAGPSATNRQRSEAAVQELGVLLCTGKHGIRLGKIDYLVEGLGEAVSVMRSIKRVLNPDNLLNPGKVVRI